MPLIPADALGAELGIHPETVRRLYREGRIPAYRVGRGLRFDVAEVRDAFRTSAPSPDEATTGTTREPDFDALDEMA
jgi:excisionase family DNA binding protein